MGQESSCVKGPPPFAMCRGVRTGAAAGSFRSRARAAKVVNLPPIEVERSEMPHRLDNWTFVYRSPIALLLLAAITTGCEKAIDPQTGDTAMRLTVPGTSANETARATALAALYPVSVGKLLRPKCAGRKAGWSGWTAADSGTNACRAGQRSIDVGSTARERRNAEDQRVHGIKKNRNPTAGGPTARETHRRRYLRVPSPGSLRR